MLTWQLVDMSTSDGQEIPCSHGARASPKQHAGGKPCGTLVAQRAKVAPMWGKGDNHVFYGFFFSMGD